MATRHDPRYVASDDPRAVLRAWGGDDLIMDMGGWTDHDRIAFEAAIQDEATRTAGEPLRRVRIELIERGNPVCDRCDYRGTEDEYVELTDGRLICDYCAVRGVR